MDRWMDEWPCFIFCCVSRQREFSVNNQTHKKLRAFIEQIFENLLCGKHKWFINRSFFWFCMCAFIKQLKKDEIILLVHPFLVVAHFCCGHEYGWISQRAHRKIFDGKFFMSILCIWRCANNWVFFDDWITLKFYF